MNEGMVAIFVPIVLFISIAVTIISGFYFGSKVKISMAENGQTNERPKARPLFFLSMRLGFPLIGAGVAMLIYSVLMVNNFGLTIKSELLTGLLLICVGIGCLISYLVEKKWWEQKGM